MNDGQWSLEERWDWDHTDIARKDLPAQVDKILEITGKEKVTLMAYSQGTLISVLALAAMQDYWAERVDRYISLATCGLSVGMDYETQVAKFQRYDELGYLNFGGNDASSVDTATICEFVDDVKMGCGDDGG